ncbi:hypothetical protein BCR43DRAFT_276721 [Syncephalastrum racemosum]|uniref:Uncharacterized protein n=1 Tax=Syncephalastrum racemosum TaxID=13706 RepID=A0A1X2HCC6_SYNRA|nr:hypothetical protein BCR43DRAFT_276721 [Syncephalastrum racemosum]
MSVFSAFASFARGLPNPTHPSVDATEMTQIVDLEGYIQSLDARLPLHSPSTAADEEDDSSSLSSESVNSVMRQTRYKPAPAEDDDTIHNHAVYRDDDDVNQRLVPGDLENGQDDNDSIDSLHKEKRTNHSWVYVGFMAIFLLGLFIWFGSMAAIGKEVLSSEATNATQHINLNDLYNRSFIPRRPTLEPSRWCLHFSRPDHERHYARVYRR